MIGYSFNAHYISNVSFIKLAEIRQSSEAAFPFYEIPHPYVIVKLL